MVQHCCSGNCSGFPAAFTVQQVITPFFAFFAKKSHHTFVRKQLGNGARVLVCTITLLPLNDNEHNSNNNSR